jgi:predicted permease
MLSHAVWQSRFGAQTSVIGTTIRYGGEPVTIVGVTPPWFRATTDLWRPLIAARQATFKVMRGSGGATTARLRPGVTIEDAQRVLTAALPPTPAPRPGTAAPRVVLTQELETRLSRYRPTIATLAGSVGLILLIACVNVAGLLLARGATRQGEVAVRTSLGASRRRLIRQFLTESLVLSTIGGTLGILLAWLTLQTLLANIPLAVPADAPARINGFVLVASVVLTLLTGTLFGLAPALRLSRDGLGAALARSGRQHGAALTKRGGQSLIAIEVALAVVMLAGAGLMIRSFSRLVSHDLGFDPRRFIALDVIPADPVPAVYAEYYSALVRQLRAMPSVAAAGAIDVAPLVGGGSYTSATADGRSVPITMRQIIPGYFETIGLAAASGRLPADADLTSAEKTIVLSTSAAAKFFPGEPAVGRQLVLSNVVRTVIGVVPDVRHGTPGAQRSEPNVYFPYDRTPRESPVAAACLWSSRLGTARR